jgi:4'-phosphopantetheinyl transferase
MYLYRSFYNFSFNMDREILWQFSPKNLTLENERVHIWRADLNLPSERVYELANILSPDERERAERYKFQKHRQRFIVARSTLRKILSNYLNLEAERLEFNYSDRGKPFLAKTCQQDSLQFNLSHSQELAIYAITKDKKIGIDLEYLRPMPDAENIAKRFFSANEYTWISSLAGVAQREAFFRYWTAKEAYLKATGEGIAGSLESVEVDFTDPNVIKIKQGDRFNSDWLLHNFMPKSNYTATIAVENKAIEFKFSYWQGIEDF